MGDSNDRSNGSSKLIFTTSKIGFFLTVEFVSFDSKLLIAVLSVGNADEVVLLVVNKSGVTACSESIGGDAEHVFDTLVGTINHDGRSHEACGTVTSVVDKGTNGQTGIIVEDSVVNSGNRIVGDALN